jgi:hypothetical protein
VPLPFVVPLRLMMHEGVTELQQPLYVPVRRPAFVEALGVDRLERRLIA